jgi:hypothetical protein
MAKLVFDKIETRRNLFGRCVGITEMPKKIKKKPLGDTLLISVRDIGGDIEHFGN